MKTTNRATQFSRDLKESLNQGQGERFGVKRWRKNWKPKGVAYGGVDVARLDEEDEPIVLVEAELRRKNPVSNVVKVWMWATKGKLNGRFLLVQAFSSHYKGSMTEHRRRARFIGKRMHRELGSRVRYVGIDFEYRPRKHGKVGAGRRRCHAKLLAGHILECLELIPLRSMKGMRGCLRGIETSVGRGRRHA
jgi:hypothetical protein